jgi:hypothetical protein
MARVLRGDFSKGKPARRQIGSDAEPVPDYRLLLSVCFSDPLIWRRLLVPGTLTLADLHRIIQISLGWGDCDAHRFLVGKIFYQPGPLAAGQNGAIGYDEAAAFLHQLEEGMQFIFSYLYDGGQGWELELALEEVIRPPISAGCPAVLTGDRGCPPESIGDIHRFQALLAEPDHDKLDREIARLSQPGGAGFSVTTCDIPAINQHLAQHFRCEHQ